MNLGDGFIDKFAMEKVLGIPQPMTLAQIDQVVEDWKHGALVSKSAGFAGIQLHAAHGFLLSQFLSPYTNRRTDEYGGSPAGRLKLLQRLVLEIRELCPPPFCLSVKLNSGDYMEKGGLTQDEALEQVRWLTTCGHVDMVEISGGNAENKNSGLHNSFGKKSLEKAPKRKESTRIREAYFTEFAEKVRGIEGNKCPIQLSGGFRSRIGMADAIESGVTDLIGLGRTAVLEPSIPKMLLDPSIDDEDALAMPHLVKGMWLARLSPRIVGGGLPIQFFYYNMRRLGNGLKCDPDASLPVILFAALLESVKVGVWKSWKSLARIFYMLPWGRNASVKID